MSLGRRVAALAGLAALLGCGDQATPRVETAAVQAAADRAPQRVSQEEPPGVETVWLAQRSVAVAARPAGRTVSRIRARTPYGSRTRLWVRARRGDWLKVAAIDAPRGVGWIHSTRTKPASRVVRRIVIDRSARRLTVTGGKRTWSTPVVVGASSSPTPVGTFQVTDRLRGARFSGVYGDWILPLSAYGTPARDSRLAVHGVPPAARSNTGSAGCVRVPAAALRRLVREVVPGTPVHIRA